MAELDFLRSSLADRYAVLAPNEGLNGGVDVETADAHGLECDNSAERDNRCFARTATNVDDHAANWLIDRKASPDGSSHGLFDELGLGGTSPTRRFGDGTLFYFGDGRRDTDDHSRPIEPAYTNSLQQQSNHFFRDVEVGYGTAT